MGEKREALVPLARRSWTSGRSRLYPKDLQHLRLGSLPRFRREVDAVEAAQEHGDLARLCDARQEGLDFALAREVPGRIPFTLYPLRLDRGRREHHEEGVGPAQLALD